MSPYFDTVTNRFDAGISCYHFVLCIYFHINIGVILWPDFHSRVTSLDVLFSYLVFFFSGSLGCLRRYSMLKRIGFSRTYYYTEGKSGLGDMNFYTATYIYTMT